MWGKLSSCMLLKGSVLNENETRLPVTPVTGPYYRWDELRAYYLAKLNAYK